MTTAKEAIIAIKEARGFITTAAKRLGISRTQLYRIVNAHPTVSEALQDAREEMKDFAEAQLFQNIRDGKETSLIFFLKTQAKDRGYIERQEINQQSLNIDLTQLSDAQLQRIADGEPPAIVLADKS